MRKIIGLLLILGMAVTAMAIPNIAEADDDTFTITVTCGFVELTLKLSNGTGDYSSWPIGTVATSATPAMIGGATGAANTSILADVGTSSSAATLSAQITGAATNWTDHATTIGEDVYVLKMDSAQISTLVNTWTDTIVSASDKDLTGATAVAAGDDSFLFCKFLAPSSTTTGSQQTITITITITAS